MLILRDRSGATADFKLTAANTANIEPPLRAVLAPDAILCSDGASVYRAAAQHLHLTHRPINLSAGVRVIAGVYHVQNVNAYDSRLKGWMHRFHGLATKYLENYLGWRRWLERWGSHNSPQIGLYAAIDHQLRLVYLPREILAMLNQRTEKSPAKRHTIFVKLKPTSRFARLRGIPTDAANFEEIVSLGPNGECDGLESDHEQLSEDGPAAMVDALSEDAAARRLHDWVSRLSPSEGEILCRRFGLFGVSVETAEAIAERIGIDPRYVYWHTTKALRKLRAMAEAEGFPVEAVLR